MSKVRAVEMSLFPDYAPDKPVGPILPSVFVGTNADLMAAVAPYYLNGSVCDVTYGEGKWWERFTPDPFTRHDLYKVDGVDFRALPEADGTYDAVCFDPPYIPTGGYETSTVRQFHDGFGLRQHTRQDLWRLIEDGLAECARVLKSTGYIIVKCCDFVSSGQFWLWHFDVMKHAETMDLVCHDLIIHHTGSGPGGWNIFEPKRARRHHSYLLVFTKVAA